MLQSQQLRSWAVIAPQGDGGIDGFWGLVISKARQMKFQIQSPMVYVIFICTCRRV